MSSAQDLPLGKKPGVVVDPRTIQLKKLLGKGLPMPPAQSYVGKDEPIRMYGNDRYGSCTCTAHGHRIDVHEKASRQLEIQLTTEDVLKAYSDVTGFDPERPETDNGAYMLDVLNYQRRTGMGREADGSRHHIGAFAQIDLLRADPLHWKRASWMFGGLNIGAWLPISAAYQLDAGKSYWRVTEGEDAEPGSWGGHAMHLVGYSEGSAVLATWGQRIRATWEWLRKYCDEAYVVISEDLMKSSGATPQGFRLPALYDALEDL